MTSAVGASRAADHLGCHPSHTAFKPSHPTKSWAISNRMLAPSSAAATRKRTGLRCLASVQWTGSQKSCMPSGVSSASFSRMPWSPFSRSSNLCNPRTEATITRGKAITAAALPFAVPEFRASKLSVDFKVENPMTCNEMPTQRFYTLTHNDLTGDLFLTVDYFCNVAQISGWYNRLVRDEILAEWEFLSDDEALLHVHCHVSGEEAWLAPPLLRNYIFRREMQLVLDCFVYADRHLLECHASMANAKVIVHLESNLEELNRSEEWGILGDRNTWQPMPIGLAEMFASYYFRQRPSTCSIENPPPVTPAVDVASCDAVWDSDSEAEYPFPEKKNQNHVSSGATADECGANISSGKSNNHDQSPTNESEPVSNLPAVHNQHAGSKVRRSPSRYTGVDFAAATVPTPVVAAAGRRRGFGPRR